MAKYTYRNETVLKEFVGRFLKALAKRKGKQVAKVLAADPKVRSLVKKGDDLANDLKKHIEKNRKEDPEYDAAMSVLDMLDKM
jgi:hypothetical protein|tara:strand:+ start:591 stop:839 length:249 start_codon:yes stop_codon:yes gene_type:complete